MNILDKLTDIAKYLYQNPIYLATALIVILFLYILRKIKNHFAPVEVFDNKNGVIRLEKKALYEVIGSACYNMGATNKPKIKLCAKKKKLLIDVYLKLDAQQKVAEFASKLQEGIQVALDEQLGIARPAKINVNITSFKGLLTKPISKKTKPAKEEKAIVDKKEADTIKKEVPVEKKEEPKTLEDELFEEDSFEAALLKAEKNKEF